MTTQRKPPSRTAERRLAGPLPPLEIAGGKGGMRGHIHSLVPFRGTTELSVALAPNSRGSKPESRRNTSSDRSEILLIQAAGQKIFPPTVLIPLEEPIQPPVGNRRDHVALRPRRNLHVTRQSRFVNTVMPRPGHLRLLTRERNHDAQSVRRPCDDHDRTHLPYLRLARISVHGEVAAKQITGVWIVADSPLRLIGSWHQRFSFPVQLE